MIAFPVDYISNDKSDFNECQLYELVLAGKIVKNFQRNSANGHRKTMPLVKERRS